MFRGRGVMWECSVMVAGGEVHGYVEPRHISLTLPAVYSASSSVV